MNKPFPRLGYVEVMDRFGTDKPDLRFGMELKDVSDIVADSEFDIFRSAIANGGKVKGICAPGCAHYSRHQLEELNKIARDFGAGGLVTISLDAAAGSLENLTAEMIRSAASKFLTIEHIKAMAGRLGAKVGDLLLLVAGDTKTVNVSLGELRREMGQRLNMTEPEVLAFVYIVDFPLLEKDDKTGRWQSLHHPFTAPRDEDIPLLDSAPEQVRARSYDFVCNGSELSSGSIRIHTSEMQRKILNLLGHSDADIEKRFGHLLEAFDYGAPPHGGIAPGIDRIVMLLAGEESIREVVAFPKNQNAADLTFNAPSPVTAEQLSELHISLQTEEE